MSQGGALHASSRLETAQRATQEEIEAVRASLSANSHATPSPSASAAASAAQASNAQRLEQLKATLASRRMLAMQAYTQQSGESDSASASAAGGDQRVRNLKQLLSQRSGSQGGGSGSGDGDGAHSAADERDDDALDDELMMSGGERGSASPDGGRRGGAQLQMQLRGNVGDAGSPRSASSSRLGGASNGADAVHNRLFNLGLSHKLKMDMQRRQAEETPRGAAPQINETSRSIVRTEPVESVLLRRSAEYRAHIEDLRRQREAKEAEALRSPQINKQSQKLAYEQPIEDRLVDFGRQVRARRESLRSQAEREEASNVRPAPEINRTSRQLDRSVDNCISWQRERDRKLQQRKEMQERATLEEVKGKPTISKVSRRLAERQGRSSRVEDNLLAYAQQREQRLAVLERAVAEKERGPGRPVLSSHSSNLQRDGSATDRLYELARRSQSARQVGGNVGDASVVTRSSSASRLRALGNGAAASPAASGASAAEEGDRGRARSVPRDPGTGQAMFQPQINARSRSLVRNKPVEDILNARAIETQRAQEAKKAEQEKELRRQASQSKLGALSQLLADLMERRTQQPGTSRLQQPIGGLREQTAAELRAERDERYTFRPHVNPVSAERDRSVNGRIDSTSRAELLQRKHDQYEERRSRMQVEAAKKELAECTFSPNTASSMASVAVLSAVDGAAASAEADAQQQQQQQQQQQGVARGGLPAHTQSTASIGSTSSVAQRNMEWLRKKQERVDAERRAKEQSELEGCTFQPDRSLTADSQALSNVQAPPNAYRLPTKASKSKLRAADEAPSPDGESMRLMSPRTASAYAEQLMATAEAEAAAAGVPTSGLRSGAPAAGASPGAGSRARARGAASGAPSDRELESAEQWLESSGLVR